MSHVLNPPYLTGFTPALRQMLFDDVGNLPLNMLLRFGEGCYHDDTIAVEYNVVPG